MTVTEPHSNRQLAWLATVPPTSGIVGKLFGTLCWRYSPPWSMYRFARRIPYHNALWPDARWRPVIRSRSPVPM